MRTFLGYLLVAAGIAALYGVIRFAPLYIDHLSVKDIVNSNLNRYREFSDVAGAKNDLLMRLNTVEWTTHKVTDEFGNTEDKAGLGLEEEAVEYDFEPRTKTAHIKVSYDRQVKLVPTEKIRVVHFVYEVSQVPPNLP